MTQAEVRHRSATSSAACRAKIKRNPAKREEYLAKERKRSQNVRNRKKAQARTRTKQQKSPSSSSLAEPQFTWLDNFPLSGGATLDGAVRKYCRSRAAMTGWVRPDRPFAGHIVEYLSDAGDWTPYFKVSPSTRGGIGGLGLVADRQFNAGPVISAFCGRRSSSRDGCNKEYTLKLSKNNRDFFIDGASTVPYLFTRFANHDEKTNCVVTQTGRLVCEVAVPKGGEILINYGDDFNVTV
jgi:hypothetical protein